MDARFRTPLAAIALSFAALATSAAKPDSDELLDLGRQTQRTQEQVLDFERDAQRLEDELAVPAGAQRVEIYLSLSAGRYFRLDRAELEVDGKPLARHDYDLRAREALRADGVHLLYRGPLPRKGQRLRVRYTGQGGARPEGEGTLDLTRYRTDLLVEISVDDAPDEEGSAEDARRTDLNARVWALPQTSTAAQAAIEEADGEAVRDAPAGLQRELALQHARYLEQTRSAFSGAAALLAAQQQGQLDAGDETAAQLLVGWYQQLGLYNRAAALAHDLKGRWRPEQHNRFWLAQARLWLRRDEVSEAEAALRSLQKPLDQDTEDARQSLLAASLMRQQRYAAAIKELEDKQGLPRNSVFDRYNRGVALAGLGRLSEGLGQLDELGQIPAEDETLLALRDRANLALGWAWLAADQGGTARPLFKRVRQDGLHANMALLGLGWAELAPDGSEQERIYTRKQLCNEDQLAKLPAAYFRRPARDDCNLDKLFVFKYRAKFNFEPTADASRYENALKPWRVLGRRKARDPAVQEGLLATGFAYEQLGAREQAEAAYRNALQRYQEELKRLGKLEQSLQQSEADPLGVLSKQAYRDEYSTWRSSQAFAQAAADIETLQRCDAELEQTRKRLSRLQTARAQSQQLVQLRSQLSRQSQAVAATRAALRQALQRHSLDQVAEQRERLTTYLTRTRLALAALYEQGGAQ
ncbi:MAG: tetratricopeptide repeat protein [Nevskiales bacterium]